MYIFYALRWDSVYVRQWFNNALSIHVLFLSLSPPFYLFHSKIKKANTDGGKTTKEKSHFPNGWCHINHIRLLGYVICWEYWHFRLAQQKTRSFFYEFQSHISFFLARVATEKQPRKNFFSISIFVPIISFGAAALHFSQYLFALPFSIKIGLWTKRETLFASLASISSMLEKFTTVFFGSLIVRIKRKPKWKLK